VEIASAVKKEIEREVAKVEKTVDERIKAGIDKFERAAAVAAVGINKGTFDNVTNPLRDSFIAELAALGADDAVVIADRTFKKAGEPYAKVVLAQAAELAKESDESLGNFSRLVKKTAYVSDASEFVAELSSVGVRVKGNLETASVENKQGSALQRSLRRMTGRP